MSWVAAQNVLACALVERSARRQSEATDTCSGVGGSRMLIPLAVTGEWRDQWIDERIDTPVPKSPDVTDGRTDGRVIPSNENNARVFPSRRLRI